MTTLHAQSKQGQRYINALRVAIELNHDSLRKVYKSYSTKKELAYERIQRRKDALLNKSTLYIIGYNCDYFTTAYQDDNAIIVDTKTNTYYIPDGWNYL